ncbi:MAG: hypothetical protein FWH18_05945 [Marinilabiliaceae bacterium]|nr:hypothetical protein [Marinilabiliaceae bacterium]
MKNLFVLLFIAFAVINPFFAHNVQNAPFTVTQPNGEVLELLITGDEFFRRLHDSEGYTIVQREDGWYCYALYDASNDELIPSEFVVGINNTDPNLLPLEKRVGISYEKYIEIRRAYFEHTGCDISGAAKHSILEDLANSKTTAQINNIIICIGFSDTESMTVDYPTANGIVNTNPNNNMRDYFDVMSYGKLDLLSHFYPPPNGNTLRFYQAPNPRVWYKQNENSGAEHNLLRDAINWVNEYWPVPEEIDLDVNNDGYCDFITFVLYGPVDYYSTIFWPHKWTLYTNPAVYINGKRVYEYNVALDAGGNTYFNSGTFCHEGFHVLGAPDLYHYSDAYDNLSAVGRWDIMEDTQNKPQSMSAYMKLRYGKWVYEDFTQNTFPQAEMDKTYEVFPFYYNDGSDPEKPILHRIPLTNITNQYSAIEYRKRTGTNYDANLQGEGLLIYRINTSRQGNAQFNGTSWFDEVYIYRPNSSQTGGVYTQGQLPQAPFNTTNNRTEFNSETNPKPCQSNGTEENIQNINNILYDGATDSYTFFYGDPDNRTMFVDETDLILEKSAESTNNLDVVSNVLWRVSIPENDEEWLSVSTKKGLNYATVTFTTLSENSGETPRMSNVTFIGNDQSFIVNVIQSNEVGIKENMSPDFLVYGNSNKVYIVNESNIVFNSIQILDLLGRVIYQGKTDTSLTISTEAATGYYLVKLVSENGIIYNYKVHLVK